MKVDDETSPPLPNFTHLADLALFLKKEKIDVDSGEKSGELFSNIKRLTSKNNEKLLISDEMNQLPGKNDSIGSSKQSTDLTHKTKSDEKVEEDTESEGEYLKKYVTWYINNAEKGKQQYIQKHKELTHQLGSEKEKRVRLEQNMVKKEQEIANLLQTLKTEKKKAMDREKIMNENIERLGGKRQKMNQFCVRCEAASLFKFQPLSFCSDFCLKETAKSLNSVQTV